MRFECDNRAARLIPSCHGERLHYRHLQDLIPQADMVLNLTPDKQHTDVVKAVQPLMKHGACLSYSHGFNIVEEGMQVRDDITVIMVAPKCPGTEVREEYLRGFGVPTLIAVHRENDPNGSQTSRLTRLALVVTVQVFLSLHLLQK